MTNTLRWNNIYASMYRLKLNPVSTEVVNDLGLVLKIDPVIVQKFGAAPTRWLDLVTNEKFSTFSQGYVDQTKKNFYDQIIAEMGAMYEEYLLPNAKWYKSRKLIANTGKFVLFLLDNGVDQKYLSLVYRPNLVETGLFGNQAQPYFTDYAYTVPLPTGNLYTRVLQGLPQNVYWPAWQVPGMSFGDVNYEPLRDFLNHIGTAVYSVVNYVEVTKKSILIAAVDTQTKVQYCDFYADRQLSKSLKNATEFANVLPLLKNFSIEDSNLDLQDFEIQSMRVYFPSGTHICYLQKS